MPYLLLIVFLVLLIINYFGCGCDFFNPAVIFSFMNFLSSLVCAIAVNVYDFPMHFNTVLVLSFGGLIFTIINLLVEVSRGNRRKIRLSGVEGSTLSYIIVRKYWLIFFILFELLVAYSTMQYVRNVVRAYYGTSYDFATSIGQYNRIVKNHGEEFRSLGVRSGAIYTYGSPLSRILSVFLAAIWINNYILSKKKNILLAVPIIIPVITSLFTGSRSTAFRLLTAFIAEYIIIYRQHTGNYRRGSAKLLRRLIIIAVAAVAGFSLVINIMGRAVSIDAYQYFVAYIGGPFLNLDLYLQNPYHSSFFGQETFQRFYSYLGSRLGISSLRYDLNLPYNRWNGIYLGNVYTMYYMFIEDFGYWGIFPLTSIIALFYTMMYSKLINLNTRKTVIGPSMLLYSYLINDVIMLTFSNRFYETILSTASIRIYFWLIPLWFFYKRGLFRTRIIIGKRKNRI